ncbi:MAG: RNA polymerase sigma factor [Planctomycetota bacterium JB042]
MTAERQHEEIRAAIGGDRAALEAVWREHRRWTAAVLLAHAPAGADLDDLLQDVALKLCRSIATLDDPGRFGGWLRAIALNTARSAGRRRAVAAPIERPFGSAGPEPVDARGAARTAAREERDHVLLRIRRLEPEYREPLLMKAMLDLSQRRIAALLGLPETTIETRLVRARRMLRDAIELEDAPGEVVASPPEPVRPEVRR